MTSPSGGTILRDQHRRLLERLADRGDAQRALVGVQSIGAVDMTKPRLVPILRFDHATGENQSGGELSAIVAADHQHLERIVAHDQQGGGEPRHRRRGGALAHARVKLPPDAAISFSSFAGRKASPWRAASSSSLATIFGRPTVSAQNIGPPV